MSPTFHNMVVINFSIIDRAKKIYKRTKYITLFFFSLLFTYKYKNILINMLFPLFDTIIIYINLVLILLYIYKSNTQLHIYKVSYHACKPSTHTWRNLRNYVCK